MKDDKKFVVKFPNKGTLPLILFQLMAILMNIGVGVGEFFIKETPNPAVPFTLSFFLIVIFLIVLRREFDNLKTIYALKTWAQIKNVQEEPTIVWLKENNISNFKLIWNVESPLFIDLLLKSKEDAVLCRLSLETGDDSRMV